jgi:steroid 5-alpha reductase family enzyme
MSGERGGIIFKPEFALGHLVQIVSMVAVALAVWFGLVGDVQRNRDNIATNTKSIEELRLANSQLLKTVNEAAERREARMMARMGEIKDDVSWLVRREADREGKK